MINRAVFLSFIKYKNLNIPKSGQLEITASTRLPDFVIIGAQQGGTTWLQAVLHQHPNIHIPPAFHESHFFNRSAYHFDTYVEFFNQSEAIDKVLGERSPNYFDMPKARIEYMKEVLPNVKLVVVLREPTARAWSHARMELSNYHHQKLTKYDTNNALLHIGSIRNVHRTDYARLLENWLAVYPREQFLIAFHHDILENPIRFLKSLYDFIQVDHFVPKGIEEQVAEEYDLDIPTFAIWFLQRQYRSLPMRLNHLGIDVPTAWQQPTASLPWWQKCRIWLWIVPRNILFDLTYSLYKKRKEERTPIPKVIFLPTESK